ncbi:MAG: GNAT family N-acetyltransferase [Clostridium sp.]|nr:GNAT family N-acetyltransferase [Clostridium sp.]
MLKIKRALELDAPIITAIKTRAYNKELNTYLGRDGGPTGYNEVKSEVEIIRKFIAYKIELDSEIIGSFFLIPSKPKKMHFDDFVIDPKYQGQGYGYKVLQLIENAYPLVMEWRLQTPIFSIKNQHLYTKFGYVEIARSQYEIEYLKQI